MSGHKQWSEIRHKSQATIPDINQVRTALAVWLATDNPDDEAAIATLQAVARAFVDGELLPASLNMEAVIDYLIEEFAITDMVDRDTLLAHAYDMERVALESKE